MTLIPREIIEIFPPSRSTGPYPSIISLSEDLFCPQGQQQLANDGWIAALAASGEAAIEKDMEKSMETSDFSGQSHLRSVPEPPISTLFGTAKGPWPAIVMPTDSKQCLAAELPWTAR